MIKIKNLNIWFGYLLAGLLLVSCGSASDAPSNQPTTVASPAANLSLVITPNTKSVPADGTTPATVIVTVKDAQGVPLEGIDVTFASTPSSAAQVSAGLVTTDASGTVTVDVIDLVVENVDITATAGSVSKTDTIIFTATSTSIIPTGVGIGDMQLAVDVTSVLADGSSRATLTAVVKDANGQPMPLQQVSFSDTTATGLTTVQISSGSVFTDNSGTARVYISDPVAETVTITASVGAAPNTITRTQTVSFVPATAPQTLGTITANMVNGVDTPADGQSIATMIVVVRDTNGSPMVNQQVTFSDITDQVNPNSPVPSAAQLTAGSLTTDASGVVTIDVANSLAQTVYIQAIAVQAGVTTKTAVASAVFATVQATGQATIIQTPAWLNVTVQTQGALLADGSSAATIIANVKDSYGAAIPNYAVTFIDSTKMYAQISAGSVNTDASGTATVTVVDPVAESVTILITAGPKTFTQQLTFTAVAIPSSNQVVKTVTTSVLPSTKRVAADGVSLATITVNVKDTYGSPVAGRLVSFTDPLFSFAVLSAASAFTDAAGTASVDVSDTVAEFVTIQAQVDTYTATETIEFTSGGASNTPVGFVTMNVVPAGVPADGTTPSTITVNVKDIYGIPMMGEVVTFADATGYPGAVTGSSAQLSAATVTTDAAGTASIDVLDLIIEPVTIKASVGTFVKYGAIDFQQPIVPGGITGTPTNISVSTSAVSVKTDNSNSATITAIVVDKNNAAVGNATVLFSVTAGQLTTAIVKTDANGVATTTFSAGTEKINQTVNVTATSGDVPTLSQFVPVQITGTTISTAIQNSNITDIGTITDTLTATVNDAAGTPVFNTPVTYTVTGTGAATITPTVDNYTDVAGNWSATVTGTGPGNVTVTVTAGGATAVRNYVVSTATSTFAITAPTTNPYSMTTTPTLLTITVQAPGVAPGTVSFATSLGLVSHPSTGSGQVINVPVDGYGNASVTFTSPSAGVANIQVYDTATQTSQDTMKIYVSQPVSSANSISLQSNVNVVAPSLGGTTNTATLTAKVRDVNGQAVANAPVLFTIPTPTGGGESISPVVVYTDALGNAQSTFSSGSISSGAQGVDVFAKILNTAITPGTTNIVVGGTAGSVVIGTPTEIVAVSPTTYSMPVSVIVADSNGNPAAGQVVSLKAWPKYYSYGYWLSPNNDGKDCVPVLDAVWPLGLKQNIAAGPGGSTLSLAWANSSAITRIPNEDTNRNLLLDPGEDLSWSAGTLYFSQDPAVLPSIYYIYDPKFSSEYITPANDGVLTPHNSAAGTVPSTVITDANGVANFDLVYLKQYSAWVVNELTASTQVLGTEITTSVEIPLTWLKSEATSCVLPQSPFNMGVWPN